MARGNRADRAYSAPSRWLHCPNRDRHDFGTTACTPSLHDPAEMLLDRAHRDRKPTRDLSVAGARHQMAHDGVLPLREHREMRSVEFQRPATSQARCSRRDKGKSRRHPVRCQDTRHMDPNGVG